MLEASKRKTVTEIEKKYLASTINSTYVFPLKASAESNQDEEDSYNNSLDVDFYNLKA